MTIEQKLMQSLMRVYSSTRRHSHKKSEEHPAERAHERHAHERDLERRPERKGDRSHKRGSRGSANILSLLKKDEGITQQQIAETLGIRAQSVSEAISVLENRGLVRKEPSETDKRKSLVFITDEGLSQREEMQKDAASHAEMLFSALTDEEKSELLRLLEKINMGNGEETDKERDDE